MNFKRLVRGKRQLLSIGLFAVMLFNSFSPAIMYAQEVSVSTGYIQGRTFLDKGGNGLLLSSDGDYTSGMYDGFTVRLYDSTWTKLGEQTTNTTGEVGQYKFDNLADTDISYYVCGVNRTDFPHSPASIGQTVVKTDGTAASEYATGVIVTNASGASDESPVCWQVTLNNNDGAYLGIGYTYYASMKFGYNGATDTIGVCNYFTNDKSANGGTASLQVLQFSEVMFASYYMIQGYSWNGSAWQTNGSAYNPADYPTRFNINNGVATYTTWATNPGTYAYKVTAHLSDGTQIGETSTFSNYNDACKFVVDRELPVISFTDDVEMGPVFSDDINISVSDTNPDTSTYFYTYTDGACDSSVSFIGASPYTSGSAFTIADENNKGKYICAMASDATGSTSYKLSTNPLNVDLAPSIPTALSIKNALGTNIGCNGFVRNRNITLDWNDNPESDIAYYNVQNMLFTVIGSPTISEFDRTLPNIDGTYKFRVNAQDTVGNTSSYSDWCNVTLDRLPPTTPKITTPVENDAFNTTPILNDWTDSFDAISGVKQYNIKYLYDDGRVVNRTSTASQRNHTPALWEEGGVTVWVQAEDNAGNLSPWSKPVHYYYDITKPTIGFTHPLQGSIHRKPLFINGFSTDEVAVDYVEVSYKESEDTDWTFIEKRENTTPGSPFNWALSSLWSAPADGRYQFKAKSTDTATNTSEYSYAYDVIYDTTNPYVEITSPAPKSYISGAFTVDGNAADKLSGVTDQVRIRFRDKNNGDALVATCWATLDKDGLFSLSVNDGGSCYVPDGYYLIRAMAKDQAGNEGYYTVNRIIIDNQAPHIDTTTDMSLLEGEMLNLGFLDEKGMSDNERLNWAYVNLGYTGRLGSATLVDTTFDISDAGCGYTGCGKGGTLNELFNYVFGEAITFADHNLPIDTSLFQEGIYTFNYYVTDMAGNRSDCDAELEGDQNCQFSITITNVAPIVTLDASQTINEGESAKFTGSFTDPSSVSLIQYLKDLGYFDKEETLPEANMTVMGTAIDSDSSNPFGLSDEQMNQLFYSLEFGDDSPWSSWIDYGAGDGEQFLGYFQTPGSITIPDKLYTTSGDYTATLRVCEARNLSENIPLIKVIEEPSEEDELVTTNFFSENECSSASVLITVKNLAPTVLITASPSTSTTLPTTITLTANATGGNAPYASAQWSGACSGTGNTYTLTSAGTYTCTYTVVDADGDSASNSITVQISSAPAATGGTGTVLGTRTIATGTAEEETEEEELLLTEEEETGEVLGATTCDEKTKTSGFVFTDKNSDGKKDESEKGVANIKLIIYYTNEDGDKIEVASVTTDKDGKWSAEVCPGNYKIELLEESLPKNYKVAQQNTQEFNAQADSEQIIDFALNSSSSLLARYWWLLLLALLLIGGGAFVIKRRE